MNSASIQIATEADVDRICEIYNHYILNSTATFHLEPESRTDRLSWMRQHNDRHPVTVAVLAGQVVGWGSLSHWNLRPAYDHTAEISVYVDHRHHRKGLGKRLVVDLIQRARQLGHHVLIGGVCTEQTASMELQKSLGFVEVARFKEIGYKFDRWLDVAYLQMMLD